MQIVQKSTNTSGRLFCELDICGSGRVRPELEALSPLHNKRRPIADV